MGLEYRLQTYDFERAEVPTRLRDRGFDVRDTDTGFAIWAPGSASMPSVEIHEAGDEQMLVIYGASPAFSERVVGLVLMLVASVNDHVVLSEA